MLIYLAFIQLASAAVETSNPQMCRNFAITVRSLNLIRVNNSSAELSVSPDEFYAAVEHPLTNSVLARVDCLISHLKLVLKLSAAIGHAFCADTVHRFHPGRIPASEILSALDELCKFGFLDSVDTLDEWTQLQERLGQSLMTAVDDVIVDTSPFSVPDRAANRWYAFHSKRCRKVILSIMLHSQRQQLHDTIAKYFEGLSDYSTLRGTPLKKNTHSSLRCIAYHWRSSSQMVRALGYIQEIGVISFRDSRYEQVCI